MRGFVTAGWRSFRSLSGVEMGSSTSPTLISTISLPNRFAPRGRFSPLGRGGSAFALVFVREELFVVLRAFGFLAHRLLVCLASFLRDSDALSRRRLPTVFGALERVGRRCHREGLHAGRQAYRRRSPGASGVKPGAYVRASENEARPRGSRTGRPGPAPGRQFFVSGMRGAPCVPWPS